MTTIAFTTQNRREISEHAGRCRRYLLARIGADGTVSGWETVELEREQTLHDHHDGLPAGLDGVDLLITRGAGPGLARRLARSGVQLMLTGHTEPEAALQAWRAGTLVPADSPAAGDGCGHAGCDCHG